MFDLNELKRIHQSYPSDLYDLVDRLYYPTLFMGDGRVLVSTKTSFADFREAYAYADYKAQGKSTVMDFGFTYHTPGGHIVHVDGEGLQSRLESYWERKGEEQVMRYFEEGNFA